MSWLLVTFVILLILFGRGLTRGIRLSRDNRSVTHPECGHCGYDVRGLPTFICPECGRDLREVGILTPGTFRPPKPDSLEAKLMKPMPAWVSWAVVIGVIGLMAFLRLAVL